MTSEPVAFGDDHAFHSELFASLGQPEIPAALRDESFLHGVYERATESTGDVGALLEHCLTPSVAPEDAAWVEVDESPVLSRQIEDILPNGEAPGWLWTRVRQDMREQRAARLRTSPLRSISFRRSAGLAAAAIVLCAVWLGSSLLQSEGTPFTPRFVNVEKSAMTPLLVLGR